MRLEFTTLLRQKKPGYDNKVVKEIKETKNNCILIKVRTGFHLSVKFGSFVYYPYKNSGIGNNNM
jgi:phage pi2 protein 07